MIAGFFVCRENPKYSENHNNKVIHLVSKFREYQLTRIYKYLIYGNLTH